MHHKNDFQLDVNDARQMYCTLRENGNNNTYLMEVDNQDKAHFDILDTESPQEKSRKIAGLQAIYQKQGLPHDASKLQQNIRPEDFQPAVQDVKKKIEKSSWKKRWIRNAIDIASIAGIAGWLYSKYRKK